MAGTAGLLAACGSKTGTTDCAEASSGPVTDRLKWKMVTTWPRDFPGLGTGASHLAELIGKLSNGRLTVEVYGGNELVPPFEVFDAVQRGTAEMGHGASYYWKGKISAALFLAGTPFGLTGNEINGWFYHGGGLELYREAYAPFGVIPFPTGNSGTQMGGWFNKEINSTADLDGLKMRIPGIGAEVIKRLGATPVNIPGAELFTALQSGTIDATEWVGPMNDLAFGLFRAAKYYYYPGWHEPSTQLELIVNKKAYDGLPEHLRVIIDKAATAAGVALHARMEAENARTYAEVRANGHTQMAEFPQDVLAALHASSVEALAEEADKDAKFREVRDNYEAFRATFDAWDDITEDAYRQYFNRARAE